jgi:hypothetical protein
MRGASGLLRLSLSILATCSCLLAIFLALTAIPETGRNPASSDFGWLRTQWLEAFVVATALLALTIYLTSGRIRMLFAALLLITWTASVVPGFQFWTYQILPDIKRLISD